MTNEQLRMQMLAGVITESEYKEKISLNEGEVTVKDVEDRIEMYTKHMAMLEKTLKTAQDKIAKEKKKAKPNQYNIEKYLEDVEFAKDEIKKDKAEIKYDQKRLEKLKKKESLNEEAFDNPFAAKVPQPQKGGGLQLKNAAMKVYSYIKKNGFTPYLVVDSKTVGDRMNHDFSIQVQRGGASEEGVLVVQGNRNKTNPQVMEKLQNDIIADFPFLTKHNQSNPSQLVIKLAVDPKANVSESLNEHYIAGGIVGIGAITQIPSRAKTDYEMAFEHFLGERYETKFENREQDLKEGDDDEMPPAPSHEETDANQVYEMEGEDVMPKFRAGALKQIIAYAEKSGSSKEAIQDLKDALAKMEAEIEAEKNKKPLPR